jgi:hypothetical protein
VLELAESLLLAESVSPRALARGLFLEATQQMSLVQALLVTNAIDEAKVEEAVAKEGDPPPLGTITPSLTLVQQLPRGLCARLLAIPIGRDPQTGEAELAVVDLRDVHAIGEVEFFLRARVRPHRATVSALRAAIEQIQRAEPALVPQIPAHGERSRTPIWGTPVVSVAPIAAPHTGASDMPIPLMRRSSAPASPTKEESAVLELRTPASSRPAPDTIRQNEDPVFALRSPPSMRRPVSVMIAETRFEPPVNAAVTIPAPKQDTRHTMVTAPAPPRRSEPPPAVTIIEPPRSRRASSMAPRFSPGPALPFPDATPVFAAMEEANDRDAIIALLISGMRAVSRRVAVMAVKRDSFVGWSCNAEFGDARAWRLISVPANVPSVLATAAAGTPYLGPLFRTDGHMPILEFMRETSRDVAVTGVRVDMHPALVLLADELGDSALGTRRMEQLAKAAGHALARVLRKK